MYFSCDYYTMAELVEIIKMSQSTIRRRIKKGEFPFGYRNGRKRLWSKEQVEEMHKIIRKPPH